MSEPKFKVGDFVVFSDSDGCHCGVVEMIQQPHAGRAQHFYYVMCNTFEERGALESELRHAKAIHSATRWFPQHAIPSLGYDSEAACQEYLDEIMCPCAGKPVKVTLTWEEPS